MGKKSKMTQLVDKNKESKMDAADEDAGGNRLSWQKNLDGGDTIETYIQKMTGGGKAKMHMEHEILRKQEHHIFFFMRFPTKNRYSNMVLYNEGAVLLNKEKDSDIPYYHATHVNSKFGKFICAQAPTDDSLLEFYQMIWQQKVQIIVCLANPQASPQDCHPYFEFKKDKKMKTKGRFLVRTVAHRQDGGVTNFELRMANLFEGKSERTVHVIVYPKWHILKPSEPAPIISALHNMWALEQTLRSFGDAGEAPVLVHGSSGVRRTGAFVTIASVCRSIKETGQVCLLPFIHHIRNYRYGALRNKNCFCTTLETILQFALDQGQIPRDKRPIVQNAVKAIRDALAEDFDVEDDDDDDKKKGKKGGKKK